MSQTQNLIDVQLDSLTFIDKIEDLNPDIVLDSLEGAILGKRFLVNEYLGRGQNGIVYGVTDLNCEKKGEDKTPLVIKVQVHSDEFSEEIAMMEDAAAKEVKKPRRYRPKSV